MITHLLFAVASLDGGSYAPPPPPPVPVVQEVKVQIIEPIRVTKPVVVKTEPIIVHMESEDGVVEYADEAVSFDTGDGIATTDRATYDKLVEAASLGETDAEYYARLNRQYCEAKPWSCEGTEGE